MNRIDDNASSNGTVIMRNDRGSVRSNFTDTSITRGDGMGSMYSGSATNQMAPTEGFKMQDNREE